MCKKLLCHRRLTCRNEYVHSAEVVPWQMFVATYAGMSIRIKNSSDLHYIIFIVPTSSSPQIAPAVMPAQRSPAPASSLRRCRRTDRPPPPPPTPPPPPRKRRRRRQRGERQWTRGERGREVEASTRQPAGERERGGGGGGKEDDSGQRGGR